MVNVILLFSQPTNYFNGKVINSATNVPLPFATVTAKTRAIPSLHRDRFLAKVPARQLAGW
jgi:hypothetical protein